MPGTGARRMAEFREHYGAETGNPSGPSEADTGSASRPWPACVCTYMCVCMQCPCGVCMCVLPGRAELCCNTSTGLQEEARPPHRQAALPLSLPPGSATFFSLSPPGLPILQGCRHVCPPHTQNTGGGVAVWCSLQASVAHQPASSLRNLFTTCKTFISLSFGLCMCKNSYLCRTVVDVR